MIHWGNGGVNPYVQFDNWLDNTLTCTHRHRGERRLRSLRQPGGADGADDVGEHQPG